MRCIDQARRCDNRRAVLVIMKHRNIELFAKFLLDNKAFGRANIFEIDTAKCIAETLDAFDEFFGVFFLNFDIKYRRSV